MADAPTHLNREDNPMTNDLHAVKAEAHHVIHKDSAALTEAASALENWGRHFDWCALSADTPCNCGLAGAIRKAHAEAERIRTRDDTAARLHAKISGLPHA